MGTSQFTEAQNLSERMPSLQASDAGLPASGARGKGRFPLGGVAAGLLTAVLGCEKPTPQTSSTKPAAPGTPQLVASTLPAVSKPTLEDLCDVHPPPIDPSATHALRIAYGKYNFALTSTVKDEAVHEIARIRDPRATEMLLQILREGKDVPTSVSYALKEVGPEGTAALLQALTDPSDYVRVTAMQALGRKLDDPKVLKAVLLAATTPEYSVKVFALGTLSSMDNPPREVQDALVASLDRVSSLVARDIAYALIRRAWAPANQQEQISLAVALEKWEELAGMPDSTVPLMRQYLKDADGKLRIPLARALVERGDEPTIEVLLSSLQAKRKEERFKAGEALAGRRPSEVIASMLPLLRDPSSTEVRRSAATVLEAAGWTPATAAERAELAIAKYDYESLGADAINPLIAVIREQPHSPQMNERAAKAVIRIGAPAIPALQALLMSEDRCSRSIAAYALGQIKEFKPNEDEAMRIAMARRHDDIVKVHGPKSIPILVSELTSDDSQGRKYAAEQLHARWQPKSDADRVDVYLATEGYSDVTRLGAAAVPRLLERLQMTPYYDTIDHPIIKALGEIRDPRAIEPCLRRVAAEIYTTSNARSVEVTVGSSGRVAAAALQKMWPARAPTDSRLLDSLKAGNVEAGWIAFVDPAVRPEAMTALYDLIVSNPLNVRHVKSVLFASITDQQFTAAIAGLPKEQQTVWSLLYKTRRDGRPGITDDSLKHYAKQIDEERVSLKKQIEEHLTQDDVRVLNRLDPKTLSNVLKSIAEVTLPQSGFLTWAGGSHARILEDIRHVELVQRIPAAKLLATAGYDKVPKRTEAEFKWSGAPSVPIRLPALKWSSEDLPALEELSRSEHRLYRRLAEKQLKRMKSTNDQVAAGQ